MVYQIFFQLIRKYTNLCMKKIKDFANGQFELLHRHNTLVLNPQIDPAFP